MLDTKNEPMRPSCCSKQTPAGNEPLLCCYWAWRQILVYTEYIATVVDICTPLVDSIKQAAVKHGVVDSLIAHGLGARWLENITVPSTATTKS